MQWAVAPVSRVPRAFALGLHMFVFHVVRFGCTGGGRFHCALDLLLARALYIDAPLAAPEADKGVCAWLFEDGIASIAAIRRALGMVGDLMRSNSSEGLIRNATRPGGVRTISFASLPRHAR